jgi:omega-amidase
VKVALASLDQKWEDKAHNLERCKALVGRASDLGAELVIFPEMTLTGFTMNVGISAEDPAHSPSIAAFSDLARLYQLWVIAGIVLAGTAKAANTLVAFSPDGAERARYVKIHPFSLAGEATCFQAGGELATVKMPEFSLGLSICYDLRFPELYSALAASSDVLVNIANWPKARVAHWRVLLRARAIENQVFVIGVNRSGTDGAGLEYEPSSVVVNPDGGFLAPIVSEGELDLYDLKPEELVEYRSRFSTRPDRVPELYRRVI